MQRKLQNRPREMVSDIHQSRRIEILAVNKELLNINSYSHALFMLKYFLKCCGLQFFFVMVIQIKEIPFPENESYVGIST